MLKNYSKIKVNEYGDKFYLNDKGKYHRLDGPAFEFKDGSKHWLIKGKLYRNIDPAIEYRNGSKYWFFNNKCHRIGGSCNSVYGEWWYIHDKGYTKKEYFNIVWEI